MKRRIMGLIVLGLSIVLGILGGWLVALGIEISRPYGNGLTRGDLVAIVGGVCLLAAIVALVRGARYLIAGDRAR